jgi:glycine/D-amino acid oxidase-like deaminating enzyme
MSGTYDFAVVGGGIVGLACAYAITRSQPSNSACWNLLPGSIQ